MLIMLLMSFSFCFPVAICLRCQSRENNDRKKTGT